jgi:putative ABC transport system permease protein
MNLWEAVVEALQSLTANKLRSTLTVLGIVIGVAAVIAMLSVGKGAQNSITGSINSIGSNLIIISPGNSTKEVRNARPLTLADARALQDPQAAPSIQSVAPSVSARLSVSFNREDTTVNVSGITPEYEQVRNHTVQVGQFITQENILQRSSVALIGTEVANKLFGSKTGGMGESIRIAGQPFRVVGILEEKGGGAMGSSDNTVLVPLTTAQSRLVRRSVQDQVDMIYLEGASSDGTRQAMDEARQILRARHHIGINPEDFTLMSQEDFLKVASQITNILTIFLGGIAGISLLVGGIGIMNIMLVSVTERTREIGLRKAIGARRMDILLQFLTESSILSLMGGVVGIGMGWLIALLITQIAQATGNAFTAQVSVDSIVLATAFSTAVGLFFGIYPANRAAGLVPVEALRSN